MRAGNCIDCHMPLEPTNAIASATTGEIVQSEDAESLDQGLSLSIGAIGDAVCDSVS